ncbi:MAG: hypothetical protein CCU26_10635 [Nitrospira sp. UW-LDO-01]|nr:MAG: hypothetical protein CCU26_10635 [Nitrospira sp. UW-LDO-01]
MSDHLLDLVRHDLSEMGPPHVETSAKIADRLDDTGRGIGGYGQIQSTVHTLKRDDGGVVLCAVPFAREKGFWALVYLGIATGMFHQPVDSLLYGQVADREAVGAGLRNSRVTHQDVPQWLGEEWRRFRNRFPALLSLGKQNRYLAKAPPILRIALCA